MDAETQYRKVVSVVRWQLLLLVAVVFGVGYFYNNRAKASSTKSVRSELVAEDHKLPIKGAAANTYPEMKFGSDKKFESYVADHFNASSDIIIEGNGIVRNGSAEIKCILKPNGQLIGRYRHENGTTLDVNGYIDSNTDDLKIHLGHGNERSQWNLSPIKDSYENGRFHYTGTWGKRNLKSDLTITIKKG